ncbi:MAG: urease accessory protein UreD [Leptolyngbyaceae cyanobacterium SL_7_1]|nr:urease accessory protein UreD [Leptolyngbyaceae cyanobacterium SL_7_1]
MVISADQSNWQGVLQLDFGYSNDKTQLDRAHVQAPLKVQRSFYPEGSHVCHIVTLHTAGGIVGGDRLSTQITLQPHAHALLTSAAAGKIYRSNGAIAKQTTQLTVAAGAWLEWLPQETIVFDGAQYDQYTRVELAETALWLGWEITRFGRTARGEQFNSGVWRSRTEVWQGDRPLWIDSQQLHGGSDSLTSPHGLGGCAVVGSFALVGRSISSELIETARSLYHSTPSTSAASIGVTRLMGGMLCRYRGNSTAEARRWFVAVWDLLRRQVGDRPACPPRVW